MLLILVLQSLSFFYALFKFFRIREAPSSVNLNGPFIFTFVFALLSLDFSPARSWNFPCFSLPLLLSYLAHGSVMIMKILVIILIIIISYC